jgi:hypothetical protein
MTTKTVSVKKAAPKKLPPNPLQSEILDLVSKQRTKAKKFPFSFGTLTILFNLLFLKEKFLTNLMRKFILLMA